MRLRFRLLPDPYAVVRLDPATPFPLDPSPERFISVTRTADELSIVCREAIAPEGGRIESGWRALQLEGPIPFDQTGVAAAFTVALATSKIGAFVVSTFDTDYLLVKKDDLDAAREALRAAEIEVIPDAAGAA
jgi:hypothetical protein